MKNFTLCLILLCAGCLHSPARWSIATVDALRCNMRENELSELPGPKLQTFAGRRADWSTHYVRKGNTQIWFGIEQQKLKSYQLFTMVWKGVKERERVILCD